MSMCIKQGSNATYIIYPTKEIKKICLHDFVLKCVNLHFSSLKRRNLAYLNVINQIMFGIVVHIKMMFWMYLIFIYCE